MFILKHKGWKLHWGPCPVLTEISRNHYVNLEGKWFEPVKCVQLWGALCISQCNEIVVPQRAVSDQGSIQHHSVLILTGLHWLWMATRCRRIKASVPNHLVFDMFIYSVLWSLGCAGGRDSGGLLTNHCTTALDSNMSHFKNSPSLQALKIPAHLLINTYCIYNFLL